MSASDLLSSVGAVQTLDAPHETVRVAEGTVGTTGTWDRLWEYKPTDVRDDALLEREAQSARWAAIKARLLQTFGRIEGLRTIELGSGRGDLSALLARHGVEVTLVDMSEAALGQARHRFARLGLAARYVAGDLFTVYEREGSTYDVALSCGVIEHFTGDRRSSAVRAHYDVLRRGGVAVISVPHAHCVPYRIWKRYLELRGWWPYGMEIPYTKGELQRRAREVGFTEIELCASEFLHSVSSQFLKAFAGRVWDWRHRRSWFDRSMGLVLLMMARRPSHGRDTVEENAQVVSPRRLYYPVCRTRMGHRVAQAAVGVLRGCGAATSFSLPLDALRLEHRAVAGLMELWPRIHWAGEDGMMPPAELLAIYELAVRWPVEGDVVELGAWKGLTTSYLATACRVRGAGQVYAVDTFEGTKEGGQRYSGVSTLGGSTLPAFRERVRRAGLESRATPLVGWTDEVAARYPGGPIRLLLIDADHSYEGVMRDYECWLPLVAPGGLIVFHDYAMPGVRAFVEERVAEAADVAFEPGVVLSNVVAVTKGAPVGSERSRAMSRGAPVLTACG